MHLSEWEECTLRIYLVEVWSLLSGRSVHYIPGGGVVSLEWEECTLYTWWRCGLS